MIDYFNRTVDTIRENENLLKSKIEQLLHIVVGGTRDQDKLFIKDIFHQLNTLYTLTFNILQDVENSLTFCKLHTIHPSIIKSHDLLTELNKISKFYNNQLPININSENILELEKMLFVNCKLSSNKITYFIEIPINYETQFELIHLIPIPTKHNTEYVTVIPNQEYFLRSNDGQIKSLYDVCTYNKENTYQCPNKISELTENSCEKNFISHNNIENCQFLKLNIRQNHIEYLTDINQHLIIFPDHEEIKIKCKQGDTIKTLQGIFLVKEDDCLLEYKNQNLLFKHGTFGKPVVIENYKFDFNKSQIPKMSIELNTINELKPMNKLEESIDDYFFDQHDVNNIINYSTLILYIILITGAIILLVIFLKRKFHRRSLTRPKSREGIELQPRTSAPTTVHQLPDEAQF